MPTRREGVWLIAYDIADPKRLSRVHRRVAREALQVQYSVYCWYGRREELENLIHGMEELIDPAHDDVRVYPVPDGGFFAIIGRSPTGPDTWLSGLRALDLDESPAHHPGNDGE